MAKHKVDTVVISLGYKGFDKEKEIEIAKSRIKMQNLEDAFDFSSASYEVLHDSDNNMVINEIHMKDSWSDYDQKNLAIREFLQTGDVVLMLSNGKWAGY
ncbi:MAG: hypothetical protein NTZ64_18560 [Polaromonas sp.]|nr:hypothetical protein [Polaromonas sp.]